MPKNRTWKLTLNLPEEPERVVKVPESQMVEVLQGLMRGEAPADAEVLVREFVETDGGRATTLKRAA